MIIWDSLSGTIPLVKWKGTRVLVTGVGGFIGNHLVEELLERGARVRAMVADRLSKGAPLSVSEIRAFGVLAQKYGVERLTS